MCRTPVEVLLPPTDFNIETSEDISEAVQLDVFNTRPWEMKPLKLEEHRRFKIAKRNCLQLLSAYTISYICIQAVNSVCGFYLDGIALGALVFGTWTFLAIGLLLS